MIRQIRPDTLRANSLQDGSSNTREFSTKATKALEFWLNVTGIGASGDYDFEFETSMGEVDAAGAVWKSQVTTVNITATGLTNVLLNRIDHALGERARVSWVKNTTTVTFDLKTTNLE